jgi:hypothetical protein
MNRFGRSKGGGRRTAPRERALLFAVFTTITKSRPARVIDVSATGLRLLGQKLPRPGESLEVAIDTLRGFGTVIWSNDSECGVEFDAPFPSRQLASVRKAASCLDGLPPQLKPALEGWLTSFAR